MQQRETLTRYLRGWKWEALWQRVLLTEWGGMNDVLFNLYSHSGDATHLATARRFNGYVFTARLAVGLDDLAETEASELAEVFRGADEAVPPEAEDSALATEDLSGSGGAIG